MLKTDTHIFNMFEAIKTGLTQDDSRLRALGIRVAGFLGATAEPLKIAVHRHFDEVTQLLVTCQPPSEHRMGKRVISVQIVENQGIRLQLMSIRRGGMLRLP